MTAYAKINTQACHKYAALSREIFSGLNNFSLKSKSDHINEERSGTWAFWLERRDKLDEIWWDLRGWQGFMNYEEVLPIFHVFYELNPDEFILMLSESANPYLVTKQ